MARLVASHEWYLRQVGDAKQFISNTKDRRELTYEQSSASILLFSTILNILLESHLNLLVQEGMQFGTVRISQSCALLSNPPTCFLQRDAIK